MESLGSEWWATDAGEWTAPPRDLSQSDSRELTEGLLLANTNLDQERERYLYKAEPESESRLLCWPWLNHRDIERGYE